MMDYAQNINDDLWPAVTGFKAESGPLNPVFKLQGRDVGQVFLGFILGVAVIMGLLWYRGGGSGGSGFSTITSIFDFRKKNAETRDPNLNTIPTGPVVQVTPFTPSRLRVKVDNLTLRSCAGFDCAAVATLPRGETVNLVGDRTFAHDMEWVRVRVGSQEGWVSRYFLE